MDGRMDREMISRVGESCLSAEKDLYCRFGAMKPEGKNEPENIRVIISMLQAGVAANDVETRQRQKQGLPQPATHTAAAEPSAASTDKRTDGRTEPNK